MNAEGPQRCRVPFVQRHCKKWRNALAPVSCLIRDCVPGQCKLCWQISRDRRRLIYSVPCDPPSLLMQECIEFAAWYSQIQYGNRVALEPCEAKNVSNSRVQRERGDWRTISVIRPCKERI